MEWADAVTQQLLNITAHDKIHHIATKADGAETSDGSGLAPKPSCFWQHDILQRAVAGIQNGADPNEPVRHDERLGDICNNSQGAPVARQARL